MSRRAFLKRVGIGAGAVTVIAGDGVAWRVLDQGVLATDIECVVSTSNRATPQKRADRLLAHRLGHTNLDACTPHAHSSRKDDRLRISADRPGFDQ